MSAINSNEVANEIINEACLICRIDKETLLNSRKKVFIDVKYQCLYLIKANTILTANDISDYLGLHIKTIVKAIEQIKLERHIYNNTLSSLNSIIFNIFLKKYYLLTLELDQV